MPNKASHRCAWPGCVTLTTGRRCPPHQQAWQHQHNLERTQYRGTWPKESAARIAAHRALNGDVCPGYGRAPHPIDPADWTCDHDLGPLCRSCNGRKGATTDKQHRRRTT